MSCQFTLVYSNCIYRVCTVYDNPFDSGFRLGAIESINMDIVTTLVHPMLTYNSQLGIDKSCRMHYCYCFVIYLFSI